MKKNLSIILLSILLTGCELSNLSNSSNFNSQSTTSITQTNTSKISSFSSSNNNSSTITSSSNHSSISTTTSSSESSMDTNSTTTTSSSQTSSSSSSSTITQLPTNLYQATINSNAPDYYESVRGLKGQELKDGLHEIIKGHTTYSYNSDINEYMKEYDVDYDNSNNINLIYTGSASKNTSFNKEHVWAKSHGDFGTSKGPGSDLHNLRPCYNNLNSTRGNLDFAEGGNEISSYPGNYKTSSTFEPRDDFKGDVARTIFYMATRYENSEGYPDLEVESPTNTTKYNDFSSGAKGVHGDFDDLYKWATSGIDPVDNYEVNRNNIIYEDYQHNRNPFIDHPEFIIMIYDKEYNGPGALLDLTGNGTDISPEEQAEEVISLILNIGEVNLNSLELIEEAENAYNRLSNEAKQLINSETYQVLLDARATYEELYNQNIVNIVIELIDSIGQVTLESESLIKKAEQAYNKLNEEQKLLVTNYNELLNAREVLNELLEEVKRQEQVLYSGLFKDSQGATSSYGSATITLENKSWYASNCYHAGDDFRLGYNKSATLDSKFTTALGVSSVDGSSLEMKWDIENAKKITFISNGSYKTIQKIYILKSLDGGNTYNVCSEFTYSDSVTTYSYEGDYESNVRYALVISGSKPRLKLTSVEIIGLGY